jgi:hypothetical protein
LATERPNGVAVRPTRHAADTGGRIDVTRLIIPFVLGVLGPIAIIAYLLLQQ